MKNYEKYAEEIRGYEGPNFCNGFIIPHIFDSKGSCSDVSSCDACRMLQMIWLMKEYREPEVDWSKIKVDTPILVKQYESSEWVRKHFAKYEDGTIYAWTGGRTSWNAEGVVTAWKYVKLAESEEGGEE